MTRRFVTPLTHPEQQALTSAYQHGEKGALRRRTHAILLSHQGHTIRESQSQKKRKPTGCWLPSGSRESVRNIRP